VRFGQSSQSFGVGEACWLEDRGVLCQSPNNFEGRLGNPALERADAPARVPGLVDIVSLSDSGRATCAVRADGVALCWGRNRDRELVVPADTKPCRAYGSERSSCNSSPTPLPVPDVAQVLLTPQEMFVLTRAGIVLRSGDPRDAARSKSPALRVVAGLPPAVRLVRGTRHPYATCALTRAGEVYCFGQGAGVGDGAPLVSRVPVQISGVRDAVEVHAALTDACMLRTDGTVTCWGDREEPRGLRDIVSLGNPCALARDGRVWCWGENSYGEMGLGRRGRPGLAEDIEIAHVPLPVPGLHDVVAISTWLGTTCAVDRAGIVRCWGTWGPTFPTLSPTVIRGIPPATQVWAANGQQCALARGGQVWCWATRTAAASRPDLPVVSELPRNGPGSFQEHQTCAVGPDRHVICAGGPSLPDVGPVKQISTGRDGEAGIPRGCAVRANGELACWGPAFCADGSALCTGGAWNHVETVLEGVKQVSVGAYLACAVRTGGDVWCWGRADGGGVGEASAGSERVSKVDLVHLGR
jgi:alpha-tubulin suppressor-like RCC1 family protein